jgi:hypothetical protein
VPEKNLIINIHTHNNPQAISSQSQLQSMSVLQQAINVPYLSDTIKASCSSLCRHIINYITTHKLALTCSSLLCLYGYTYYKVYTLQKNLALHTWSLWRNTIPLEELTLLPFDTVMKDLLVSIQQEYQHPDNITDFLTPLTKFMHALDTEFDQLESYAQWYTRLDKIKCIRLFTNNTTMIETVPERMRRLATLKEFFLRWIAEYKIMLNNAKPVLVAHAVAA